MRILILHQSVDTSREDEADTLVQAGHITDWLRSLGHTVVTQSCATLLDMESALQAVRPDGVFNLVESLGGSDRFAYLAAALLEMRHALYTGNTARALLIAADKTTMKPMLAAAGIATPQGLEHPAPAYIVKSATEHASFGMDAASVVTSPEAAEMLIAQKTQQFGGQWIAETYIEGREFNLSLLQDGNGMRLLPPAETVFEGYDDTMPRIVDYDAKWNSDSYGYHHTPRHFLPGEDALYAALADVAQQSWKILGLRGYARIDVRVDAGGTPWVIDANPNPCLSHDAGFMAAAAQAGMSPAEVIHHILQSACYESDQPEPARACG